ncbi:hypothetical protein PAMA_002618 [Pampus argenteus]
MSLYRGDQGTGNFILLWRPGQDSSHDSPVSSSPAGNQSVRRPLDNPAQYQDDMQITRVIFCVFLETDFAIYKKKMSVMFQDNDMEVTEEQLEGGKEETGDEEEGDNDAVGNEDVEMESQNLDEDSGHEIPNPEKDKDENENKDKDENIDADNNKDEDEGIDKDKDEDRAEEEQRSAKTEEDDTGKSTMEMEDVSEINETGSSNAEEIKDHVEISEEPDSVVTDSIQSKDEKTYLADPSHPGPLSPRTPLTPDPSHPRAHLSL